MPKLTMTGSGEVTDIAGMLAREIQGSAMSCELVDSIVRDIGPNKLYLMVFEKYYMRSDNRASLTVAVSGGGGQVCVDAIGAGGGTGVFFKFSWGAENDFVSTVADILSRRGFC